MKRREILLSFVGFLLLTACLFHEVILGGATVSSAPHIRFTLPRGPVGYTRSRNIPLIDPYGPGWIHEANFPYRDEALRAGALPFWHPYEACGNPYLAGLLPGLLFPPNLLMHVGHPPLGFDLAYLARIFLAGWFLFLFLRVHHLSRIPAVTGGVLYLGSGYMVLSMNLSNAAVECAIPGLLLGLECLITRNRRRDLWLLTFMVFLVFTGGNPQASFLALVMGGLYAAFRAFTFSGDTASPRMRCLLNLGLAHGLAFLLAAPQLLPFLEFLPRAGHLHHPGLGLKTQPWETLIQWFVPGYYSGSYGPRVLNQEYYYFGVAPLALAAASARGSLFMRRFFCVALLVVMAWYFGLPGFRLLGALPFFSQITIHKYLGVYLCLFFSILAALGLDALATAARERLPVRRLAIGIAAVGVLPVAYALFWKLGWLEGIASENLRLHAGDPVVPDFGVQPLVVGFLLAAMVGFLVRPGWKRAGVFVLAAAACMEVYLNRPTSYPPRQNPFRPAAYLEALEGDRRTFRVYSPGSVLYPNTATIFKLRDIRYSEALKVDRYTRFIQRAFHFPDAGNYFPAIGRHMETPLHALSLLGVKYVLGQGPLVPLGKRSIGPDEFRKFPVDLTAGAGCIRGTVKTDPGRTATVRTRAIEEADPVIVPGSPLKPDAPKTPITLPVPDTWKPDQVVSLGFQTRGYCRVEVSDLTWDNNPVPLHCLRACAYLQDGITISGNHVIIRTPNIITMPALEGRSDGAPLPVLRFHGRVMGGKELVLPGLVLQDARILDSVTLSGEVTGVPLEVDMKSLAGTVVSLGIEVMGDATVSNLAFHPEHLESRGTFGTIEVFENTRALPRAFGVYRAEEIREEEKILDRLLALSFDASRTVILEEMPETVSLPASPPEEPPRVNILEEAPGGSRVEMEVDFAADGLLVLLDNHYPGWTARVDGETAPVLRANATFRAVAVPAGRHTVLFTYRPTHWVTGLLLAGLGLAGLLLSLFLRWRRPE